MVVDQYGCYALSQCTWIPMRYALLAREFGSGDRCFNFCFSGTSIMDRRTFEVLKAADQLSQHTPICIAHEDKL